MAQCHSEYPDTENWMDGGGGRLTARSTQHTVHSTTQQKASSGSMKVITTTQRKRKITAWPFASFQAFDAF